MKAKLLTGINAVITALLGMLGMTGCNAPKEEFVCMYGVPYASFDVSGTITDEDHQPLKDIQVKVGYLGIKSNPIYSDAKGNYGFQSRDGEEIDSVDIIVTDTAGVYESDSVRVAAEYIKLDQPEGWKTGETTVHKDFQLKKK